MRALRLGFGWGLGFGVGWLCLDALWVALSYDDVGWRLMVGGVAVAAPLLLLFAACCGVVARAWAVALRRGRLGTLRGLALRRWLSEGGADGPVETTARLVTGLGLGALWLVLAFRLGLRVLSSVRTPGWALALLLAAALGVGAVVVAVAPLAAQLVSALFHRLVGPSARQAWVARPVVVLLGVALLGAVAIAYAGLRFASILEVLPWELLLLPLFAVLVATLGVRVAARNPGSGRRGRLARWSVSGLLAALGLGAMLSPPTDPRWRRELSAHRAVARTALGAMQTLLDFDGDGAASFYGGRDCAPFDPNRGPGQLEIPQNGLDEDCSGRDVTLPPEAARGGRPRHGRPEGISARPHVVLVTTDALSFGHTGLGGYPRPVTPNLDAWAARATVFTAGFSTAPETATAFPALFSGVYAPQVDSLHPRLGHRFGSGRYAATLATVLRDAGYRTEAIVGNSFFFAQNWPALAAGFDVVDAEAVAEASARYRRPKPHTSPEVTDHAIRVVEAPRTAPLFLWVHYFDHHPFYVVPRGETPFGEGTSDLDRYDTELRFSDGHWARLLAAVEARWRPEDYLLLFTADHGEAFDDNHPRERHAQSVATPEVHVPFIVQGPRRRGGRIDGLVSHLDVVPTLLDVVGLEAPHALAGESLVPVLFGDAAPDKTVLFSLLYDPLQRFFGGEDLQQIAVRTADFHLRVDRVAGTETLSRWRQDALERTDVGSEEPEVAEWARFLAARQLAAWRAAIAASGAAAED